eukprot:4164508-Lingulodinium_polyedra.AAC.1
MLVAMFGPWPTDPLIKETGPCASLVPKVRVVTLDSKTHQPPARGHPCRLQPWAAHLGSASGRVRAAGRQWLRAGA